MQRGAEPAEGRAENAQKRLRFQQRLVALEARAIRGNSVVSKGEIERIALLDTEDQTRRGLANVDQSRDQPHLLRRIFSGVHVEHRRDQNGAAYASGMIV